MKTVCLVLLLTMGGLAASDDHGGTPYVAHIGLVAPEILGVTIREGAIEYALQEPYVPEDGDIIHENDFPHRWVIRDGQFIGALAGAEDTILYPSDIVISSGLDHASLQQREAYVLLRSSNKPDEDGKQARVVYRKTRPHDKGRMVPWEFKAAYTHTVYLVFDEPLREGESYRLSFDGLPLEPVAFTVDATQLRSEAIHISQIGFRPDDPAKVAFLSCWLGDGGGHDYMEGLPFFVIDTASGDRVFEGTFTLSKAGDDPTEDAYGRNYSGTDVHMADFSELARPGEYRVVVPGIGCSYPFPIADEVWRDAFRTSVRGLYHQRSGIALGPPHTDFTRLRNFHPDDGLTVYASSAALIDTGNGPIGYDVEPTNFGNLVRGRTDETVPNAWGGYHDAGDWDRRIQHLNATRFLLDLAELFPERFQDFDLNIPESGGPVPDIVEEALFGLDAYRRLQTAEGGIRGGIESEEHPRYGELSWQESLTVLAYAPGVWSSYWYAGTAANAARFLEPIDPERAEIYQKSALRAMAWAEDELPMEPAALSLRGRMGLRLAFWVIPLFVFGWLLWRYAPRLQPVNGRLVRVGCSVAILLVVWRCMAAIADDSYPPDLRRAHLVRDGRNYAAAELFRLTGDRQWHDLFVETSQLVDDEIPMFEWRSHDQSEAAWVFALTERDGMDEALKARCIQAIRREADERLWAGEATGFRWIKNLWRPFGIGCPAVPDALAVVRAHILTGDDRYLRGLVLAAQFGAGANPFNMSLTTGVGIDYPQHPLHIDSRFSGQAAPPGLTVLGPMDVESAWFGDWGRILLAPHMYPALDTWPSAEAFADVFWNAILCEFTIHDTIGPNAFYWGYLAARPPVGMEDD